MGIPQALRPAKVHLADNGPHINVDDVASVGHRDTAVFRDSNCAGGIGGILGVCIHPALNPDTGNAPGHFIESGIILENIEVIACDFGQGLPIDTLAGRQRDCPLVEPALAP